jgi:hypothetical protein
VYKKEFSCNTLQFLVLYIYTGRKEGDEMYDYDTCSESVLSNACKKKLKMRNRRETFEELKGN